MPKKKNNKLSDETLDTSSKKTPAKRKTAKSSPQSVNKVGKKTKTPRVSSSSETEIKDRIRRLSANDIFETEKSVKVSAPVHKRKGGNKKSAAKSKPKTESLRPQVYETDFTAKETKKTAQKGEKLRIIPLGGLGEVGKNITAIEYGNDMILVDCGIGFPDDDMPGVDLVVPDFSYVEANSDKLRGLFLTHGHEDHIGSVPYLLRTLNPEIYGTRLTLKIIENKLREFRLPNEADMRCVKAGDTVRAGCFSVEFIRVNHSIADACCLAIQTPVGTVIHTGDFKLDLTPIEGDIMNITRLGELGKRGVLLLMCESTNAERPGYTPSERTVGKSLEYIFTTHEDKRLIISTFSSNVHRVQQIIDASARHGRKVVITGRSMINIISSAKELGYMTFPDGILIDIGDINRFRPGEITVVCTGSQGEPMSALYRMAYADRSPITLDGNDVVVISASAIPGNEKLVGRIINELCRRGIGVVNDPTACVHVSGHACAEELKLMQALTKPKFFMPIHGEYRHLEANRALANEMGIEDGNIFVSKLGQVLELDKKSARFAGNVPAGNVLVDGSGVGEVGEIVLRDRRLLSQDGLIVVVASVDLTEKMILAKPDVICRGFVYMKESEELMDEMRNLAADTLVSCLSRHRGTPDRMHIKTRMRDEISRFVYQKTRCRPMVLPVRVDL